MATRNILDYQGNIIGELTLPDDATDDQWSNALASYAAPPIIPTAQQVAEEEINDACNFGQALITQFAAANALAGITQSGQTLAVISYTADLSQCLYTGSLLAAITLLQGMIADSSEAKTACSPFITNAIIESYMNQIQTYLGIPLT